MFLLPRYQREAAKLLNAGDQDEMERHIRVIYYFAAPESVYVISVYAKNEKENLSDAEKQALSKILQPIKQQEHEARSRVGGISQRNRKTHEG